MQTSIDIQKITKIIFGMIVGVFVLLFMSIFALIIIGSALLGNLASKVQEPVIIIPTVVTPTPTPECHHYASDFIGPILPCDTRGGKYEVEVSPHTVAPTH